MSNGVTGSTMWSDGDAGQNTPIRRSLKMIKKLVLAAVLALSVASTISADVPWPSCLPCPDSPPARPGTENID